MIGTIGFGTFDMGARVTEIGYWIDGAEEGKGIMSRATEKLLELAFEHLGMNRVQIRCADANTRSAAIPQKFGFVQEGRQRRHVIRDGKIYDFLIFGLLRDEWRARQNA
jgi:ribosomal-protein-serine acetyltransferase